MFVANSNPDFIAQQSIPALRLSEAIAPPKTLSAARIQLFAALKQCKFCDGRGRITPEALRLMPQWASSLDSVSLEKLQALFNKDLTIGGKTLSVKDYLESIYPGVLVSPGLKLTTYLRGSYAAYVIDPVTYLGEALEVFYLYNPDARSTVEQKFLDYKALKPALDEPKDADFADLFFHASAHIPYKTLEKIRRVMLRWGQSLVEKNPFELNLIPVSNDITRTAQEIVITTLKNDDPEALKIDRIIGRLDNYCLFTRDNIYIDYRDKEGFAPFPLSMGLDRTDQPYSFWQSILDREMNIIRMEHKHENDFCAVLAAIEHYSKGARIDESEISLEVIYRSFLPHLADDRLLKAVLKRIKDHSVDPLSYLFHFCNKMPQGFQSKRDLLWQATLKELAQQNKLGKFSFLANSWMSFEVFRNELAHWMSQGFLDFGPHNFRIAPKQQDAFTQMQRHFRKMVLLEHQEGSSNDNSDFWMQGVRALHHPRSASVLSQQFVHQLLEDMTSNDVYNEEEISRILSMGERYFGKVDSADWLEGLLKSAFAKTVLPFWEKTQMAISQEEIWIKLAHLMPSRFYPELLERFNTLFDSLDSESKVDFLIQSYPKLTEMDKSRCLDLMRQVTSSIGSISEATQKKWSAWACNCIANEKHDAEATRLFLLFSRVCDLADFPKKLRNRIECEIQALTPEQKSEYIDLLIAKGQLFQALHQLPKEPSPLLDKALLTIPQINPKQFDELMSYLDDYLQFFNGNWHEIVMQLDIEKQKRLLQVLSLEIAEDCKNRGLINPSIFLHVMEKKFASSRSLTLLWAIEKSNGRVDPKQSAQVLRTYQQAKDITADDKAIVDRLNWLLDHHKYRDCYTLLEKAKSFTQGALWKMKCDKAFLENASLDELNQYFANERMVEDLIIPAGIIPARFAIGEDLKGCLAIYQKLKSRLSPDEKCACIGLLLEMQCKKPLRNQRDQMQLLNECLPYLKTHLALFRQANGFDWVKSAAQSKENASIHEWLVEEKLAQSLIACDPSLSSLLLELFFICKIKAPVCLKEAVLEGLNAPNRLHEADYHRWLFQQLIDLAPSLIERLNVDAMPIIHLFEKICQIVPNHFSIEQLWKFIEKLSHSPEEQLKLIKGWHARSTLDEKNLQQHVLQFAPSAKSLMPFLRWMDEKRIEPIPDWDLRWKEFDESQLSLFLNVWTKTAKNPIAIIEQAISRKFSGLCFQNAFTFLAELKGNPSLQRQLNEIILDRAQNKKDWNLDQIKSFLECLEFQTEEIVVNAYKLCGFEALLSIYGKDRSAENYLLGWLEAFTEADFFLLNLSAQGLEKLSKLLNIHYETIYNNANRFHHFFEHLLRVENPSEQFVCASLMMWENLYCKLRLDLACLYIANNPHSIDKVMNLLVNSLVCEEFSLEEFIQTSERLSAECPEKDFSFSPLVQYVYFVKKALSAHEFDRATMYMFGFFSIFSEMRDKDVYRFNAEPFIQHMIWQMMKHMAWDEIDLFFMRYVLFCHDPKQKIDYNPLLESYFTELITNEIESEKMARAFSDAMLTFAKEGYQMLDYSHLEKVTGGQFNIALKQFRQKGQPIPEEWFPYYNTLNCWIALSLEKYISNAKPSSVSKITEMITDVLNLSWGHPAANQVAFQVFYKAIVSVMQRPDCMSAAVTLLSPFLLLDSMVSVSQFKPNFEFIQRDPARFGVFVQSRLQGLIKLAKEHDSHINQLRVFKFIVYLTKEYPDTLAGQDETIMTLLHDFKDKLPGRSLEFQKEMLPYVHDSVRILRNSHKYSEQQLMRFCKSLESKRVKQDL